MGAKFLARVNTADVWDDFAGPSGPLLPRTTERGGLTWGMNAESGSGASAALTGDSGIRAGGTGSGNIAAVINPGWKDVWLTTRVKTMTASPVPSLIFRVQDYQNHYGLFLRSSGSVNEYCFGGRSAGTLSLPQSGRTGVVPQVGDQVNVRLAGNTVAMFVNGEELPTNIQFGSFPTSTHVGFLLNNTDTTSSFDSIGVYRR